MLTFNSIDDLRIVEYANLDIMSRPDDTKSISGHVFKMIGGIISWQSVKYTVIASSTMVVVFVARYDVII